MDDLKEIYLSIDIKTPESQKLCNALNRRLYNHDTDLAHFCKIGRLVEFEDIPGKVETALALSGSAAQSKIQTYPGD